MPDDDLSSSARQAVIMGLAAITAAAQVIVEPALFGLAGLLPDVGAVQAMMLGNAFAGVVTIVANFLLAGGKSSVTDLRTGTRLFFALSVVISAVCLVVFCQLVTLEPIRRAMAASTKHSTKPATAAAIERRNKVDADDGEDHGEDSECGSDDGEMAKPSCWTRYVALRKVARIVWRPALCQFLVYAATLASWPSIPGGACAEGVFKPIKASYFTLIIAAYNVMDFGARCGLPWLQRAARGVSGRQLLLYSCLRVLLVPLIYACVEPRIIAGSAGNWVAILLTMVLALSNGFLATVSFMQAPEMVSYARREDVAYVMVGGVYLGLATGCTISYAVGKFAMHLPLRC
jgi:hypothetical protein